MAFYESFYNQNKKIKIKNGECPQGKLILLCASISIMHLNEFLVFH